MLSGLIALGTERQICTNERIRWHLRARAHVIFTFAYHRFYLSCHSHPPGSGIELRNRECVGMGSQRCRRLRVNETSSDRVTFSFECLSAFKYVNVRTWMPAECIGRRGLLPINGYRFVTFSRIMLHLRPFDAAHWPISPRRRTRNESKQISPFIFRMLILPF